MFHTQIHIESTSIELFNKHPDLLEELFYDINVIEVSVPFVIDTKWHYHPDEAWKLTLSKELISLGAKEGQTIYIDY